MRRIVAAGAPQAIGAYTQGTVGEGRVLFISGQLPLDPATGKIISAEIEAQVEQSMKNLGEILKEACLSFEDLAKVTVYITDIANFPIVNEVYERFFRKGFYPARSVIEASALPWGCKVEIEGIAMYSSD